MTTRQKPNRTGRTIGLAVLIGAFVAVALALVAALVLVFAGSVSLFY
jgi:hypothetical protein